MGDTICERQKKDCENCPMKGSCTYRRKTLPEVLEKIRLGHGLVPG
ncbi:TPA_asm: hypothetical protein vir519_00037 [Caudoviricetes sp. vir519]|nr:TPA_asm: hypothetical protein vir519_00037 [Caudoviricetes sp. vir519]